MKRYVIVPGYVVSRNDGDRHWISAGQLTHLYGVDPRECIIVDDRRHPGPSDVVRLEAAGLMPLYPRNDGDYRLP